MLHSHAAREDPAKKEKALRDSGICKVVLPGKEQMQNIEMLGLREVRKFSSVCVHGFYVKKAFNLPRF